jgi:hypothetical protein
MTYSINCAIIFPPNYNVEEKPENINLSACENGVKYTYISQSTLNNLQIKFSHVVDRLVFAVHEYKDLSAFHGMLAQMSDSQIVIRKSQ